MSKHGYHHYDSFSGKVGVAFLMSSLLPYLLVIYLFVAEEIAFTEIFFVFSLLILLSMLSGFFIIRRSSRQLANLAAKTNVLLESQKSELVLEEDADKEVNDIAGCFNRLMGQLTHANREMREQSVQLLTYAKDLSLSHKKAKQEEMLRMRMSRYVGKNLVERLLQQNESELFENERREVTVLFADIRSFTSIAEAMAAEELVVMLNDFYDRMVGIVFKYSGVLDKFVGDQVVAVFGLLGDREDQASNAVEAALEMQKATEELMKQRAGEGKKTFSIGIGINTGDAVVGNIGSRNRMDYTVIGDCVNVASRLQKIAKGGEIVIGAKTNERSRREFPISKSENLNLRNKSEPVQCFFIAR